MSQSGEYRFIWESRMVWFALCLGYFPSNWHCFCWWMSMILATHVRAIRPVRSCSIQDVQRNVDINDGNIHMNCVLLFSWFLNTIPKPHTHRTVSAGFQQNVLQSKPKWFLLRTSDEQTKTLGNSFQREHIRTMHTGKDSRAQMTVLHNNVHLGISFVKRSSCLCPPGWIHVGNVGCHMKLSVAEGADNPLQCFLLPLESHAENYKLVSPSSACWCEKTEASFVLQLVLHWSCTHCCLFKSQTEKEAIYVRWNPAVNVPLWQLWDNISKEFKRAFQKRAGFTHSVDFPKLNYCFGVTTEKKNLILAFPNDTECMSVSTTSVFWPRQDAPFHVVSVNSQQFMQTHLRLPSRHIYEETKTFVISNHVRCGCLCVSCRTKKPS